MKLPPSIVSSVFSLHLALSLSLCLFFARRFNSKPPMLVLIGSQLILFGSLSVTHPRVGGYV